MRAWEKFWENYSLPEFLRNVAQQSHPIRSMMAEEAREAGDSVLDVACGNCMSYPYFKMVGVKYTGLDLTRKFLDFAREMYPSIKVHEGSALNLPFADNSFSTVCCKDLLEHLSPHDVSPVIQEMWRVASRKVMIAFFLTPIDEFANIDFVNGLYFNNRYDKREILEFIRGLDGFNDINIHMVSNKAVKGYAESPLYVIIKKKRED